MRLKLIDFSLLIILINIKECSRIGAIQFPYYKNTPHSIICYTIADLIEKSFNVEDNLNHGLQLTTKEKQFFNEHFERTELKKKDLLIKEREKERYLSFIENGIMRYWTANMRLREITFWFSFSNKFANSYLSLMHSKPSAFNIQALCDSVVWRIKANDLAVLYDRSMNTNRIARIVLENVFTRKITREISLLKLSPEDRYKELVRSYKELILTILLKYLASYIGITPQALSRIRRRIY